MQTKQVVVDGTSFRVGKNVAVRGLTLADGSKTKWKQKDNVITLKDAYKGEIAVEYDILVPVTCAAYYPLVAK